MAEEMTGKNFIEQIIEKDIAEGHCKGAEDRYQIPTRAKWISYI